MSKTTFLRLRNWDFSVHTVLTFWVFCNKHWWKGVQNPFGGVWGCQGVSWGVCLLTRDNIFVKNYFLQKTSKIHQNHQIDDLGCLLLVSGDRSHMDISMIRFKNHAIGRHPYRWPPNTCILDPQDRMIIKTTIFYKKS